MTDRSGKQCWIEQAKGGPAFPADNCSIGRTAENMLMVPHASVSRKHAVVLNRGDGQYWLINFGRNGTALNGRKILRPERLRDGDEIAIADAKYVFRAESSGEATRLTTEMHTVTRTEEVTTEQAWIVVGDLEDFSILCQRLPPERISSMIGDWLRSCADIVEVNGGSLNSYTGDGFLACWRNPERKIGKFVSAIRELRRLRGKSSVPFRIVVNLGEVSFGGVPSHSEATFGPAVNLTFRLEKVAGDLSLDFCFTTEAYRSLKETFSLVRIPGDYKVKSYTKRQQVYTFA